MEANAMQIFGLTNSQLKILYSLEKLMVEEDILLNDKGNIIKQHCQKLSYSKQFHRKQIKI